MPIASHIAAANERWVAEEFPGMRPIQPARKLVILTCMDSRIDTFAICGLQPGDAHVLRNAGGLATDDALRSISISQRALGTRDVVIIQHTDCGMCNHDDEAFRASIEAETGQAPPWRQPGFTDVDASVRENVERVRNSPWLVDGEVSGWVYEVETGKLRPVATP